MLWKVIGGQRMWKVPHRQVYTPWFGDWIKQTLWCLVVLKLFPHVIDLGSDSLKATYLDNPAAFYEQYAGFIRRANGLPEEGGPV